MMAPPGGQIVILALQFGDVKGDVARIVLYMYMHYSTEVSANSGYSKAGAMSLTNIVYKKATSNKSAIENILSILGVGLPSEEFYR